MRLKNEPEWLERAILKTGCRPKENEKCVAPKEDGTKQELFWARESIKYPLEITIK